MAGTYSALGGSVLGVEVVPRHDTDKYGIVEAEAGEGPVQRIRSIVEKPKPEAAPSTLAVVGRYVLSPGIFADLERIGAGAGGEIQLTDGIARLLAHERVYAHRFTGRRFDCGNKLGYLQATVELSLTHPTLGRDFRQYLLEVAGRLSESGPARVKQA
jgi:UTP--glucose-1-phosphate uridylyltransferase